MEEEEAEEVIYVRRMVTERGDTLYALLDCGDVACNVYYIIKKIIMKSKRKILLAFFGLTLIFAVFSCSKERLEQQQEPVYTNLDNFYDDNQLPEQTFTVDSLGQDSITGLQGTKIWGVPKTIFMKKSDHQDVFYPFTIKLIEAYSIKEMIFAKLPNKSGSAVLQTGCELKITAWKDTAELVLKQNNGYGVLADVDTVFTGMNVFYGFTAGSTNDWNSDVVQCGDYLFTNDVVTSLVNESRGYKMRIVKTGWFSPAKFPSISGTGSVTFTAEGTNTELIDIYIVFKNLHSYIKVSNLTVNGLPMGQPITIFAIGNSATSMYSFKQDYVVSSNLSVTLSMQTATQTEVLNMLSTL